MPEIRLDDLTGFGPDIDAWFRQLREAVERANRWTVLGHCQFEAGATGFTLFVKQSVGVVPAVVTTTITMAPNANTLGEGLATLRDNSGATLSNGKTGVKVYSNLSTAVAVGKRITVAPYGNDYILLNADCP